MIAWGGRWKSEQDWKDWIADGEKRNSCILARPDEYYGARSEWISWDHFLGVAIDSYVKEDGNKNSNSMSYFSYFQ